jgi:hypothetical protein
MAVRLATLRFIGTSVFSEKFVSLESEDLLILPNETTQNRLNRPWGRLGKSPDSAAMFMTLEKERGAF